MIDSPWYNGRHIGEHVHAAPAHHHVFITMFCMQKDAGDWQVVASDSFRMSGIYWAATALALLDTSISAFRDEDALVEWILSCYKPDKGCFAPNTHHDGNLLATLSAVQLMALMGRTDELDAEKIAACALCVQHALLLHGMCLACAGVQYMHVDHCSPLRRISAASAVALHSSETERPSVCRLRIAAATRRLICR